ncbi:MAG: alpha/beta hydrolase [Acidimicrobiia bacterium]|nr:alpha/beta hydrolase [Acidimicrobiia bacterium]
MSELSLLFVHSPLVGPSSMQRLAVAAADEGHTVAVPDLTSIARAASPHLLYIQLAASAAPAADLPVFVVGHSGAGVFLPAIASAVENVGGVVFVDAVVPPRSGAHRTPQVLRTKLDEQTEGGLLRRWLEWWPNDAVAELLPDPADRVLLGADMPRLPRSFYDVDVEVPNGWADGPCGYVRLSEVYESEAAEAKTRGWPTVELDSTHFGTHTNPAQVLRAVLEITSSLES